MKTEKRSQFRKNVHMIGSIQIDDRETLFACRNISLNGMSVRLKEEEMQAAHTVINLRLPSLNLQGTAWVSWVEALDDKSAALGLKFLRLNPIPDARLPIVPRPYEPYEVKEFLAPPIAAAICPILAG